MVGCICCRRSALHALNSSGCLPRARLRSRFTFDLAVCNSARGPSRHEHCTRTNVDGVRTRLPLKHIRHPGMAQACDGLCRALPYVVLEPVAVAADRSDELVHRINYVDLLLYDGDAAAAVVGVSCLFSHNSSALDKVTIASRRCWWNLTNSTGRRREVPVDV